MNEVGSFAANDETLPMAEYAIRELSGCRYPAPGGRRDGRRLGALLAPRYL